MITLLDYWFKERDIELTIEQQFLIRGFYE